MQITEITASWSETASLGNYSNVRPSLTLKATIGPDENPVEVEGALLAIVRQQVQEQVDQALERDGQPAKYSQEPRYDILSARWQVGQEQQTKILIIVPHREPSTIAGVRFYRHANKERYAAALRKLEEDRADDLSGELRTLVFDCSDGFLDRAIAAIQIAQQAQEHYWAEQERKREEERAEWKRQDEARRAAREQLAAPGEPDPYDEGDDEEDDDDE